MLKLESRTSSQSPGQSAIICRYVLGSHAQSLDQGWAFDGDRSRVKVQIGGKTPKANGIWVVFSPSQCYIYAAK
jgi:hypothetical protein